MNFKKFFIFLFICLVAFAKSQSQEQNSYYIENYQIQQADTGILYLQIDNTNFIKNNEYFGDIAEGYTLLGFNIAPKLVYSPSSKIKWSAGGNFLSYYGRENEVEARLLLSFQYKIYPNLDLILGNIYGTVNHRMIEPLLEFERYLDKNVENGIQFLWKSDRIFADLWLNWEQQILQGDPYQEKFNVGLSSDFLIVDQDNYRILIPFQNIVQHIGGQINSNNDEPLTTIFNNATGVKLAKLVNQKFIKKFILSSYIVNYQDLSPQKRQLFIDGTASYTTLDLMNDYFDLSLGYWYGEQYIAPLGNPLFESYSRTKFYVEEPIRQLAIAKLSYHKEVIKNTDLGIRIEGFYDIPAGTTDYTWAIIVVFNEKFFLKKF
ncbi:MAG: hypothetical protein C0597_14240 [Marinilabiliales bacterium]|nr:MAG: hypothetical protein C0597_14240 [Marinilabiliales bacterium]